MVLMTFTHLFRCNAVEGRSRNHSRNAHHLTVVSYSSSTLQRIIPGVCPGVVRIVRKPGSLLLHFRLVREKPKSSTNIIYSCMYPPGEPYGSRVRDRNSGRRRIQQPMQKFPPVCARAHHCRFRFRKGFPACVLCCPEASYAKTA